MRGGCVRGHVRQHHRQFRVHVPRSRLQSEWERLRRSVLSLVQPFVFVVVFVPAVDCAIVSVKTNFHLGLRPRSHLRFFRPSAIVLR